MQRPSLYDHPVDRPCLACRLRLDRYPEEAEPCVNCGSPEAHHYAKRRGDEPDVEFCHSSDCVELLPEREVLAARALLARVGRAAA